MEKSFHQTWEDFGGFYKKHPELPNSTEDNRSLVGISRTVRTEEIQTRPRNKGSGLVSRSPLSTVRDGLSMFFNSLHILVSNHQECNFSGPIQYDKRSTQARPASLGTTCRRCQQMICRSCRWSRLAVKSYSSQVHGSLLALYRSQTSFGSH